MLVTGCAIIEGRFEYQNDREKTNGVMTGIIIAISTTDSRVRVTCIELFSNRNSYKDLYLYVKVIIDIICLLNDKTGILYDQV